MGWPKGVPKSKEFRNRVSETMKRKIASGDIVVKQHAWPKGKLRKESTKRKISASLKGKKGNGALEKWRENNCPWNKGIKYGEEFAEFKEECRERNLGKKLSKKTKMKISVALKGRVPSKDCLKKSVESRKKGMAPLTNNHKLKIAKGVVLALQEGNYGAWKVSVYGGTVFRSSWEMRVARWLDLNNYSWEYEGVNNIIETPHGPYVPDFTLDGGVRIEVKGNLRSESQEKKIDWCVGSGIDVRLVDASNIDNIDLSICWEEKKLSQGECHGGGENC